MIQLFNKSKLNESLEKFKRAHRDSFEHALQEVRNGLKVDHWMWYIFPQIDGLGYSEIARHYAIKNLDEARAYIDDKELGEHMKLMCDALLRLDETDPFKIFGSPDALKLHSCITLFYLVRPELTYLQTVLDKYYGGRKDEGTLRIVESHKDLPGWSV